MKHTVFDHTSVRRIVATDPGLLSPEELLSFHNDRKSLRALVRKKNKTGHKRFDLATTINTLEEYGRNFLDHAQINISYNDFMTLITIYVLFGNDLRILYFPPSADQVFYFLNNLSFFLFVIEITLTSWVKTNFSQGIFKCKGYMFSFFFWLDFLALLSMLPDLKLSKSNSMTILADAGRAGKIGAKTGRVLRMARLLRLAKLYKITKHRAKEKNMLLELKEMAQKGQLDEKSIEQCFNKADQKKQSRVGAELSDIITRRVVVAVLLMLFVVPLLTYSPSVENEREATNFFQQVNIEVGLNETDCDYLLGSAEKYKEFMNGFTMNGIKNSEYLIGLQIEPSRCDSENLIDFLFQDTIEKLRQDAVSVIELDSETVDGHRFLVTATFNRHFSQKEWSRFGIYMTLFVIFMLGFMSSQFKADARKLVLAPIENMMEMVNMVANDPLEDYDFTALSRKSQYETRVVQIAIQKISSLLRVGFGVAGAEIISKNMSVEEGASVLQPMIPGKRVYAIFGFCDIHSFDHCTEMLQDEIMTFVNDVARIVHKEVTRWGGLCNKNLGNAFLMVWRVGDDKTIAKTQGIRLNNFKQGAKPEGKSPGKRPRTSAVDLRRVPGMDVMADKALIGFLKVVVEINRDPQVLAYRYDDRLAKDGVDFKLRLGFGLHSGWAIEGAVGSLQKVDATYLSPHVNMAARMMAASRQFGVSVLMTERFHEVMSEKAQLQCRKIDVVMVKGSAIPMPIYTFDTLQDQVFPMLETPKFSSLDLQEVLTKKAEEYESKQWDQDDDLKQLQRLWTPEFKEIFRRGIDQYLNGDWERLKIISKRQIK